MPVSSPQRAVMTFNVKDYGAKGDGSTDDATTIQATITAASAAGGGTVYFPTGRYIVGATIQVPALVELAGETIVGPVGVNYGATIIQMKAAANLDAVIAHDQWYTNSTSGSGPISIRCLGIDANKVNQSSGAGHGIVSSAWRTSVTDCTVQNALGDGIRISSATRNGSTETAGNIGEPRIENCIVDSSTGAGVSAIEGTTKSKVTDGFLIDCTIRNCGTQGANITQGAGWMVSGNHIYGSGAEGILVDRCYATKIVNNYTEYTTSIAAYGDSPGIFARAIWDCIIANNTCFAIDSWLGAGNYPEGILALNFSGIDAYFTIVGNTVYNLGATAGTGILVKNIGSGNVHLSMPVGSNQIINYSNPANVTASVVGNAQSVAYAATVTPAPLFGETIIIGTLTGNITIANVVAGDAYIGTQMTLVFTQDATGGRTISFGTSYAKRNWTPTTTANKVNTITFVYNGTEWVQTGGVVNI